MCWNDWIKTLLDQNVAIGFSLFFIFLYADLAQLSSFYGSRIAWPKCWRLWAAKSSCLSVCPLICPLICPSVCRSALVLPFYLYARLACLHVSSSSGGWSACPMFWRLWAALSSHFSVCPLSNGCLSRFFSLFRSFYALLTFLYACFARLSSISGGKCAWPYFGYFQVF